MPEVLVDTSVWVSHLRGGEEPALVRLLDAGAVLCHPFIIGELACGNLKNRTTVIPLLEALPASRVAKHREILLFIENHGLQGKGLGYIDMHLLASAILTGIPGATCRHHPATYRQDHALRPFAVCIQGAGSALVIWVFVIPLSATESVPLAFTSFR